MEDRYSSIQTTCWQKQKADQLLEDDLKILNCDVSALTIDNFDFVPVNKEDKDTCREVKDFILRYEWLEKMPNRPTHRFIARHKQSRLLGGVVVMAIPNTFSKLLGDDYVNAEKLISRGASTGWTPKYISSWLIMSSVRWMAQHTEFKLFTAYSDPQAGELGTIYQACNFIYLGKPTKAVKRYRDPNRPHLGWFSDRNFRHKSKMYMYADRIGVSKEEWSTYMKRWTPDWTLVPPEMKEKIKEEEKKYKDSCECREFPAKHKYCYILGRGKNETKKLRKLFREVNPTLVDIPYPKERGK